MASPKTWIARAATVVAGVAAFIVAVGLTPDTAPAQPGSVSIAGLGANDPAVGATTSTSVAPSSLPLADRLPGWDNTLTWMSQSTDGNPLMWRLGPSDIEPRAFEIAIPSRSPEWNATADMVAYVGDGALVVGPINREEPLAVAVDNARWHVRDPLQIAWLERTGPQADPSVTLVVGALSETAVLASVERIPLVMDVPVGYDKISWELVSWHEEGFVLARNAWVSGAQSREPRSDWVFLQPDGKIRHVVHDHVLLGLGEGVVALRAPDLGTVSGRVFLVNVKGDTAPIPTLPGTEIAGVSPEGAEWVALGPGDRASIVKGEETIPLPRPSYDVSWTSDGAYMVGLDPDGDLILVFRVGSDEVVEVEMPLPAIHTWNLRVHNTGAGE